jgi:hypothetical protein
MVARTAMLEASLGTEAKHVQQLAEEAASVSGTSRARTRQEVERDIRRELTVGKLELYKFLDIESRLLRGIVGRKLCSTNMLVFMCRRRNTSCSKYVFVACASSF